MPSGTVTTAGAAAGARAPTTVPARADTRPVVTLLPDSTRRAHAAQRRASCPAPPLAGPAVCRVLSAGLRTDMGVWAHVPAGAARWRVGSYGPHEAALCGFPPGSDGAALRFLVLVHRHTICAARCASMGCVSRGCSARAAPYLLLFLMCAAPPGSHPTPRRRAWAATGRTTPPAGWGMLPAVQAPHRRRRHESSP